MYQYFEIISNDFKVILVAKINNKDGIDMAIHASLYWFKTSISIAIQLTNIYSIIAWMFVLYYGVLESPIGFWAIDRVEVMEKSSIDY